MYISIAVAEIHNCPGICITISTCKGVISGVIPFRVETLIQTEQWQEHYWAVSLGGASFHQPGTVVYATRIGWMISLRGRRVKDEIRMDSVLLMKLSLLLRKCRFMDFLQICHVCIPTLASKLYLIRGNKSSPTMSHNEEYMLLSLSKSASKVTSIHET